MNDMKMSDAARKELGAIAAKYVENLQRSNEQMVKISALLQKQQGSTTGLSEEDKSDLYDMLDKEVE
jgi:Skp family chaperone for outer membrane proteins